MKNLTEGASVRQQGDKYAEDIVKELKKIFKSKVVDSVEAVITRTVQNGLKQFEERLQKTLSALELDALDSLSKMPLKLEHVLLYVENYVMQIFRDLLISDPPILSPSILLCDDPLKVLPSKPGKTRGDLFRETFQASHDDLVDNLDPEGSGLIDHLVEKSILTISDEESITTSGSRREKTRKLLSIVSSSPADKIEGGFLSSLAATHPHQADQFRERLREVEARPPTPTCLPCKIRNEVDLGRISSSMYKKKQISKSENEDLCNTSVSNEKKWKIIMKNDKKQNAVIEALSSKYKDFYDRCKSLEITNLQCQCPVLNVRSPRRASAPDLQTLEADWNLILSDGRTPAPLQKSASASSIANISGFSSLVSHKVPGSSCDGDFLPHSQPHRGQSGDKWQHFNMMWSSASSLANMSDFSSLGSDLVDVTSLIQLDQGVFSSKRPRNGDGGPREASETISKPQDPETSDEEVKPQKKKIYTLP